MPLTQSLWETLVDFRLEHDEGPLLADGLCTNQDNVAEKTSKSRKWNTLYEQCKRTMAHLGRPKRMSHSEFGILLAHVRSLRLRAP